MDTLGLRSLRGMAWNGVEWQHMMSLVNASHVENKDADGTGEGVHSHTPHPLGAAFKTNCLTNILLHGHVLITHRF